MNKYQLGSAAHSAAFMVLEVAWNLVVIWITVYSFVVFGGF